MHSRQQRYDYLLSALQGQDPLGSVPPMTKQTFRDRLVEADGPVETVDILLLMDDLMQREAVLAGQLQPDQADLAVLAAFTGENEPALPDTLISEDDHESYEGNERLAVDDVWERFFRYALKVAEKSRSLFLKQWIGFEVGLRNALASARAHVLGLDPDIYQVAAELNDTDIDYGPLVSAWTAAPDPLAAMEILDKARWAWLEDNGCWYSFKADELEAYAAKLVLQHRWRRISREGAYGQSEQSKVA